MNENKCIECNNQTDKEIAALHQQIAALTKELSDVRKHDNRHSNSCAFWLSGGVVCTCGFTTQPTHEERK